MQQLFKIQLWRLAVLSKVNLKKLKRSHVRSQLHVSKDTVSDSHKIYSRVEHVLGNSSRLA